MWKGPTITMDTVYPFGAAPDHPGTPTHLIRKKILRMET